MVHVTVLTEDRDSYIDAAIRCSPFRFLRTSGDAAMKLNRIPDFYSVRNSKHIVCAKYIKVRIILKCLGPRLYGFRSVRCNWRYKPFMHYV